MSTSSAHNATPPGGSLFRPFKALPSSNMDWLAALTFNAKAITAGVEVPYVKGVCGTVVFLLETIEKVQKNQESMQELCRDTVDIISVLRDQMSSHGDTAALKFKAQCEELEGFLQGAIHMIQQWQEKPRGFSRRLKEIMNSNSTTNEISQFRDRIREIRLNFMLLATTDTNFQVHKVLTVITPNVVSPQVQQSINNCPPPTRIFHGRHIILQKMHKYFSQDVGEQGIFLLHGLGGAGKTQTALKFIKESASKLTDIFLIDASSTETIDAGLKKVATSKSVGESSLDAIQWLQAKQDQWLLLFDNADDPKINLNNYFPQCTHGNILITSRNPGLCVYAGSHSEVSDMEETDAAELLLMSAAQDRSTVNKKIAAQIVKVLCYLPLAIIQAGAFISKSGNLDRYLALYEGNRARLLSQRPAQSHDNYAWTVYTTWQISFEQLSQPAKKFLQLCSFLHHQGISEEIFKNATKYIVALSGPSEQELEMPFTLLSQLGGPTDAWDSLHFMDVTNEIRAYSLIQFDLDKQLFSIHPLVHDWTRSTLDDEDTHHYCMVAILGMALAGLSDYDLMLMSPWILFHIVLLMRGDLNVIPDFRHEYAKVYMFAGKLAKATELQAAVLKKRRNLLGEDHVDTLEAMHQAAWTYHELGKFKEAEELNVVVVKRRKTNLGESHPKTMSAMADLARTYRYLGRLQETEELEVEVVEKQRNILGDNHPDTLNTLGNMALTYFHLGRFKEAEELGLAVIEKRRNILGHNHPDTLRAMANLAVAYKSMGNFQEAQQLETVVLEKRTNILGGNHPQTLLTLANVGATYNKLGRLQEAEELMLVALEKQRSVLGEDHPRTLRTMGYLVSTYNKLERFEEAEEFGVATLNKQHNILGDDHRDTVETMQNLVVTYEKMGKLKEAEDLDVILRRQKN
ncbi:hypothetical protein FB451DRAFT_1083573 [Mycena latifolia]|nr:hypothetical protein FB451DRAFT_1083573 [Mycena latifolia]